MEDNRCNWKEGILFLQKSPCWWKMGPVSKEYWFHLTKWIFFIAEYTRIFNLYLRTQHSKGCPPYSLGDISSFLVNVQPKTKPSSIGMMNKSWHQQIYIHTILQKSAPIAIGVDFPLSKAAPLYYPRELPSIQGSSPQVIQSNLWRKVTSSSKKNLTSSTVKTLMTFHYTDWFIWDPYNGLLGSIFPIQLGSIIPYILLLGKPTFRG